MNTSIDHCVISVDRLTQARHWLNLIGFTVHHDAHHESGTGNCNVYFANHTYLEPLAVLDREVYEQNLHARIPFVCRDYAYRFRHKAGCMFVALKTKALEEVIKHHADLGLSDGEMITLSRKENEANGAQKEISAQIGLIDDPRAPDASFILIEKNDENGFWEGKERVHENGVTGITSIIMVEDNPTDFHTLLSAVSQNRHLRTTSFGVDVETAQDKLSILSPEGFDRFYGIAWPEKRDRGLRFGALKMGCKDLKHLEHILNKEEISYKNYNEYIIIPPCAPLHCAFIFHQALS